MRPILLMNRDKVELNALFIQPSRLCAGNCKGCYVKEHSSTQDHMPPPLFQQLIRAALRDEKLFTNQITVSFDLLPEDPYKRSILLAYYHALFQAVETAKREGKVLPEIHGTFSTGQSCYNYICSVDKNKTPFSMISISNLFDYDFAVLHQGLRELALPKLNLNYQIPETISSHNIDSYIESIEIISQFVDSIYILIHKFPVGKEMTSMEKVIAYSRLEHDIAVINTLDHRLSTSTRKKINFDGCLSDLKKFQESGHGCSSNISRVQIWPDGTVTGCAYAHKSSTKPAHNLGAIIDNIKAVREEYDFRQKCYLPKFFLPKHEG